MVYIVGIQRSECYTDGLSHISLLEVLSDKGNPCHKCHFRYFTEMCRHMKCEDMDRKDGHNVYYATMLDFPVGSKFRWGNYVYEVVEHVVDCPEKCLFCVFRFTDMCGHLSCISNVRGDRKNVFFTVSS